MLGLNLNHTSQRGPVGGGDFYFLMTIIDKEEEGSRPYEL